MGEQKEKTATKNEKRVTIKCYATINPGEIRFGRAVEATLKEELRLAKK